jgi:PhnB protein
MLGSDQSARRLGPNGKIGHAEIRIGDAILLLADEYPDFGFLSAQTIGGSPVLLYLYVA